jgi:hypothetical protein
LVTTPAFSLAGSFAVISTAAPIVDSNPSTTNLPAVSGFSFDPTLLALAYTDPTPATRTPATLSAAATDSAFDELSALSDAPRKIDGRLSSILPQSAVANIWESL